MENDQVKMLCKHLEQEIIWIDALNALLTEEKGLLETRQFKELEELASKKQALSSQLEESARVRMNLIQNGNTEISLKQFLENASEMEIAQVQSLNAKLAERLANCRELNSVNGQVIANNLYVRQEIVNALSGNKTEAVSVYNAHGDLQSSNGNKHHGQA